MLKRQRMAEEYWSHILPHEGLTPLPPTYPFMGNSLRRVFRPKEPVECTESTFDLGTNGTVGQVVSPANCKFVASA